MTLAIASYEKVPVLSDEEELLNLAWTLDERAYLAADMGEVITRELSDEMQSGLEFVNSYFVQDPYGEELLGSTIANFFSPAEWQCSITCGAGVNSLLHALAQLTSGQPVYVIGDVYPDFPHWIERSGGTCVSRYAVGNELDHSGNVRRARASVVLIERPALLGSDISLSELIELCAEVDSLGAIVLVDESYANYYPPSYSAVNIASQVQNIVILRGLSKAYWLGGLRLGYCVASSALTERVRAVVPPMQASSLSLRLGRAVLALGDVTQPLQERVQAAKAEMIELLAAARLTEPVQTCTYVPYVFCNEGDTLARSRLESIGIIGKLQPFWTESAQAVTHVFRLSVPLIPKRMDTLRRKLAAFQPDASPRLSPGGTIAN